MPNLVHFKKNLIFPCTQLFVSACSLGAQCTLSNSLTLVEFLGWNNYIQNKRSFISINKLNLARSFPRKEYWWINDSAQLFVAACSLSAQCLTISCRPILFWNYFNHHHMLYALGGREVLFFLGTESKLLFALLGEQVFCLHQSHTSKVV